MQSIKESSNDVVLVPSFGTTAGHGLIIHMGEALRVFLSRGVLLLTDPNKYESS